MLLSGRMRRDFSLTIVIPAFNEEPNVKILASELDQIFSRTRIKWECIWIDDASTDDTWAKIIELKRPHRGIRFQINKGQSTSIMAGINNSKFENIITMDADLQNNPEDIIPLVEKFLEGYDVVNGWRKNRQDNFGFRILPSMIANSVSRKFTKTQITDLGCSLRIFKKSLIRSFPIMGEMHRVLPIYFSNSNLKIGEIPVSHRPRIYGHSKYGINRTFKFISDLIIAKIYGKLLIKPMYVFANLSYLTISIGIVFDITAVVLRILNIKNYLDGALIIGSLILFSIGIMFFCIGIVSELILRTLFASDKSLQYTILDIKN